MSGLANILTESINVPITCSRGRSDSRFLKSRTLFSVQALRTLFLLTTLDIDTHCYLKSRPLITGNLNGYWSK